MKPDSPALCPKQLCFPNQTCKGPQFGWLNYRDSNPYHSMIATHIISGWEWFPVFNWRDKPTFHKHLKRILPSEIGMWEGLCVFWLKWNEPRDALTQKKAGFPSSGLNAGSSFISQYEGMTESPVETLENAIVPHLFWTEGLTSLWHIKRCTEFSASKGDNAWLFVKIDRNTNKTVPTNKGGFASRLTSRSVLIVLPSLV